MGCALPASANQLEDRAVAASEVMMGKMMTIIEQCAPDLRGQLANQPLTPEMVEATACQVRAMRDRFGRGKVEEYISALEDYSRRDFATFMEFAEATEDYEILSDDALMEIGKECNVMEASMSSPFSKAMEENPMAIAGCFEQ